MTLFNLICIGQGPFSCLFERMVVGKVIEGHHRRWVCPLLCLCSDIQNVLLNIIPLIILWESLLDINSKLVFDRKHRSKVKIDFEYTY